MNRPTKNSNKNEGASSGKKEYSSTLRYMITIIVIAAVLSIFPIMVAKDAFALGKKSVTADITITDTTELRDISAELKKDGIINFPFAFELFANITKNTEKFKTGTFSLNSEMDYLWICSVLKSKQSNKETVWVTIPEGFEIRETFARLEEKGVCKADDLYKAMQESEFDYPFLKNLPKRENRLEGYLFPDTYEFYKNETPENVIKKMLANFALKFDESMEASAKEMGMSIDEVVILASIVEREAANDNERENVASVFLNRLDSSNLPYLQSCATVQYILKERKAVLSIADTKIDSKYNTYKYKGLPVGPIAAPGKASIDAVLANPKTDYYFFCVSGDGKTNVFAKTLAEHEQNIKNSKNSSGTGTVS